MGERRITTLMLAGGVVGPLLFIIVFLVEGATRPGYNTWRNFVSQFSTGPGGWVQIVNFLVCGLLSLGFALVLWTAPFSGVTSQWGTALLVVFSLALITAGIFATDPGLGYPPGSSTGGGPQTLHGTIHGVAGLLVFASLSAACFVFARGFAADPAWSDRAAYSAITGAVVALGFIASTVASVLDEQGILPNAPTGGLQRIAIISGWVWISLFALRLLRSPHLLSENGSPVPV